MQAGQKRAERRPAEQSLKVRLHRSWLQAALCRGEWREHSTVRLPQVPTRASASLVLALASSAESALLASAPGLRDLVSRESVS